MAKLKHSGGIVEVVLELGFDNHKYFEGTINGTAQTLTINPPARRLTLRNASTTTAIYFNTTGAVATTSVSFLPSDNVKIGPECTFTMDFDTLTSISFITEGSNALIEGYLGWKGVTCS